MSADIQSRYHFGEFELSPAEHSLKRGGKTIDLAPKEFKTLLLLAEQGGTVVDKDTFTKEVWDGAFVGDGSLARTISVLRRHIGPDAIETVPKLGYRFALPVTKTEPAYHSSNAAIHARSVPALEPSDQAQTKAFHLPGKRTIAGAMVAITVPSLALLITWLRIPAPVPVVGSITQLTDDRLPKVHRMVSDGLRVYFGEGSPSGLRIAQVSVAGGPTAPVETRFAISYALGIANDGSALIVRVPKGPLDEDSTDASLWSVPLPTGEPRCLINSGVENATGLPDGRIIFATFVQGKDPKGTDSTTDWFIGGSDGSTPRKLVSLAGYVGQVDPSPDGSRILLSRVFVDGTGLRELRKLSEDECCFVWSPDQKYLVYESAHGMQSDICALPLKIGLFRRSGKPIRLTNGPLYYSAAYPSHDGKRIFVVGTKWRGELVRYDMNTHYFVPFISGISATDLTFSEDGKWMAYASYPDGNLWRSRSDGTDRIQLTFPPIAAFFPSISPDGTKVSFHTNTNELFVVSFKGVRVAWFKDLNGIPIDSRVRTAVDAQQRTFESLGCTVEQAEPDFAPAEISFRILRSWSTAASLGKLFQQHPEAFKDTLSGEIKEGLALSASDITRAEIAHTQMWRRFQTFLENYEYFILPTTQLPPFDINTPWPAEINGVHLTNYIDWMKSCWYISATGNPAVSAPAGVTPEGLPVGLQIVGRDKQDFSVLQLSHAFEQATNFGRRRPNIAV
jgi:DNA-binding winged helix-turn-helix (wHTH) protein